MRIKHTGLAVVAVLMVAGCSGTPEKAASSEGANRASSSGANTAPVANAGLSASDRAALRDPANPLSKRSVFFEYDDFRLQPSQRALIEAHSRFLVARRGAQVVLEGHADERGSHEYNLALGQRRAEAVRKAMAAMGVGDVQIEAISLGEEKPAASGHDEAAWARNRRVDIRYLGE